MSIYIYTGTPGSGKSLKASIEELESINFNKYVVSNFEINNDYYSKHYEKCISKRYSGNGDLKTRHYKHASSELFNKFLYMSNDMLTDDGAVKKLVMISKEFFEPRKESQGLLVIDEASVLFNSRDFWKSPNSKDWLKFFSQHRKLGYDIILITQQDTALDKQLLGLVEYQKIHRCCNNFGILGKMFSVLHIKLFVQINQWYVGKGQVDGHKFFVYRPFYNQLYDTYAFFDV